MEAERRLEAFVLHLRELRRLHLHKRGLSNLAHPTRNLGLATTRRPNHEDVLGHHLDEKTHIPQNKKANKDRTTVREVFKMCARECERAHCVEQMCIAHAQVPFEGWQVLQYDIDYSTPQKHFDNAPLSLNRLGAGAAATGSASQWPRLSWLRAARRCAGPVAPPDGGTMHKSSIVLIDVILGVSYATPIFQE
jgi:hypothetical protein